MRVKDGVEDERFPECKDKFNDNCLSYQFNKNYIKDSGDIERFNEALKTRSE